MFLLLKNISSSSFISFSEDAWHVRVFPYSWIPKSTNLNLKLSHVFLLDYKGYRCLDHVTNKVYINRYVILHEHKFPNRTLVGSKSPRLIHLSWSCMMIGVPLMLLVCLPIPSCMFPNMSLLPLGSLRPITSWLSGPWPSSACWPSYSLPHISSPAQWFTISHWIQSLPFPGYYWDQRISISQWIPFSPLWGRCIKCRAFSAFACSNPLACMLPSTLGLQRQLLGLFLVSLDLPCPRNVLPPIPPCHLVLAS